MVRIVRMEDLAHLAKDVRKNFKISQFEKLLRHPDHPVKFS